MSRVSGSDYVIDYANLPPLEGPPGSMPPWELQQRLRRLLDDHGVDAPHLMGVELFAKAGGIRVVLLDDGLLRAELIPVVSGSLYPKSGVIYAENYLTGQMVMCDPTLLFEALRRLRLHQVLDDLAAT